MNNTDIRIVFFGTSDLAVVALQALLDQKFSIDLVVTMPDANAGRQLKKIFSPIKQLAIEKNLPLSQPESVSDPLFLETIKQLHPTVGVVIAFGQLFPNELLSIPQKGFINIHPSLLPLWRGPSPIQASLAAGDTQTGVTIMCLDQKMDHGPILVQESMPITLQDSYTSLEQKLAILGAKLLTQSLPSYIQGNTQPKEQDHTRATYCKLLKKEQGLIDWTQSARNIFNQIRAYEVFPSSYTFFRGKRIKIKQAYPLDVQKTRIPGTLIQEGKKLFIQTGKGCLEIASLQPAGKKMMSTEAFLAGITLTPEEQFTAA